MFAITLPFQLAPAAVTCGLSCSTPPTEPPQPVAAAADALPPSAPPNSLVDRPSPQDIRVAVCLGNGSLCAAVARALGAEGFRIGLLQPPAAAGGAPSPSAARGASSDAGTRKDDDAGSGPAAAASSARSAQLLPRGGSFVTSDSSRFASLALLPAAPSQSPLAAKADGSGNDADPGRAPAPDFTGATARVVVHDAHQPSLLINSSTAAAESGVEGAGSPGRSPGESECDGAASPPTGAAAKRGWLAAAAKAACPGDGPCVLVIDCSVLTSLSTSEVHALAQQAHLSLRAALSGCLAI